MRFHKFAVWIFINSIIYFHCFADVNFSKLRGSDLLIGVGSTSAGKSGAVSAGINSGEAIYWNPAGLGNLHNFTMLASGNPDSAINDIAIIAPGICFKFLPDSLTLSTGYLTRLRFAGDSGNEVWDGFALHILDMSMLDVGEDFQGSVDSRTIEYRVGATWNFNNVPLKAGIQICYLH